VRRIPLILAVLSVVVGLGLITAVTVLGPGDRAPASTASATSAASEAGALTASPSAAASPTKAAPKPLVYRFPVQGLASYARTHHDYPATDIMSSCGNAVVSPVDGVILEVNRVDTWEPGVNSGETRGGLSWSILGDDGVRYYGSHLSSIDTAIKAGVRVTAGHHLGKIGKTGDTTACHLHFGISPLCQRTGDWWIRRGVIWPWSYLDAWKKGMPKSPVAVVRAWQVDNGCPKKPLTDP
jgi:murein DD-endopeptidase MepM/ murein hydrolase activator NlpD